MKEERKVQVYTCDAPSCRTEVIMQADEPADGYHGNVLEVGSFGGNGADWFACRATHIRAAVEGALSREYERQ